MINTMSPFPERNGDSLKDAHNILLETIGEFIDQGVELHKGLFILFILKAC
jgi:hypothetical protein